MRHPPTRALVLALALVTPTAAQEQPTLSLSRILTAPASLFEFLPNDQWIPGTRRIARIRRDDRTKVTVLTAGEAQERALFTAEQFNAALAAAGVTPSSKTTIDTAFKWRDQETLRIRLPNGVYHWHLGSKKAELALPLRPAASPTAIAKDDSRVAFVEDHQLFVQVGKAAPKQITRDGSADIVYGGAAHRAEFGIHDGLWWSPDSRFLAFFREDLRPITIYPYVDHTSMPPKALHGRYPMAGSANSNVQVGVYDTRTGTLRYLAHGKEKDVYWTNTTFDRSGKQLHIAIVNRGQDHMEMVRFDAVSGETEGVLFAERDAQWVEPEHGSICLDDGSGRFLWFSPRDGFRNLYLYDGEGKLQKPLTKARFDVREFLGFAPGGAKAYCMGSGRNPLEMHLFEVDVASGKMRKITKDRGWHTCVLSDDRAFVLDRFSNLRNPGTSQVIELATGKVSSVTHVRHRFPVMGKQEFIQVKANDGTTLHGTTILPPGLDPDAARKYPVILYVYGGPHSQLVRDRWLGGSSLWLHFMATKGFIVCTLDNRGTDNRGIEFSQSVHRRLSELEVKDQLRAVKYLRGLPYVNGERIGVHGWSYGGYMTLNLMVRSPGTFACGAAGAPVTDWRQYETGYTERYMDAPAENPAGYEAASVVPLAKHVKGRLLIIQGTDDRTVMWSHSLAFVDRCIDAGVLVDYMPYPMQRHGVVGTGRHHLYRLLTRFFREHLR